MTQLACMFLFCHTCPCFATVRHSFLGITPHPLANRLAPNPNGRCSPLSFGSLFFSICLPLCSELFQSFALPPFHAFFSNLFLRSYGFSRVSFLQFPHFPNGFLDFLGFSELAIHFFLQFNVFTIFLHVPPFPPCF